MTKTETPDAPEGLEAVVATAEYAIRGSYTNGLGVREATISVDDLRTLLAAAKRTAERVRERDAAEKDRDEWVDLYQERTAERDAARAELAAAREELRAARACSNAWEGDVDSLRQQLSEQRMQYEAAIRQAADPIFQAKMIATQPPPLILQGDAAETFKLRQQLEAAREALREISQCDNCGPCQASALAAREKGAGEP